MLLHDSQNVSASVAADKESSSMKISSRRMTKKARRCCPTQKMLSMHPEAPNAKHAPSSMHPRGCPPSSTSSAIEANLKGGPDSF